MHFKMFAKKIYTNIWEVKRKFFLSPSTTDKKLKMYVHK